MIYCDSKSIKSLFAILLLVAVTTFESQAQRLNVAYTFSTGVDSTQWITLDSTAQSLMSTNASRSQVTNIGFPFFYAGVEQTKFSVNKYGYLRFGNTLVPNRFYPSPLGSHVSNVTPGVVVLPHYNNILMDSASHALYQVVGDTGNHVLVVEMRMKVINNLVHDTGYALFQVQLYEDSRAIRIVYGEEFVVSRPYNYQLGFVGSSTDVAFIDMDSNRLYFANTTNMTNDTSSGPEQWRWYQIEYDSDYCYHYSTPWSENFTTNYFMDCWTMLDYDASTYTRWVRSGGAMWAYHDALPCNDWMVTPLVQLPDSGDGLMLMYDYRVESSSGDYGEMEVRIAAYHPNDSIRTVDTLDFYTLLRTETEGTNNGYLSRGLSLASYAGMQVRIAFVHVRLHSSNIYVDNVQIARTTIPSVAIESPARTFAHDTTQITAMLLRGSNIGLTYTWHSTMAADSMATFTSNGSQLSIVYTHYGTDTLTCIVSNIYGSDTTQKVVDVRDCTTVTEYPWKEDFEHGLSCWHQLGGWNATNMHGTYEGNSALRSNSTNSYIETPTCSFWIMSQPLALPDTATMPTPTLLWWMFTPSQESESHNIFSVRIAVVDSTEIPPVADFSIVYTKTMYFGDWQQYRLSLEAYAGQTIRILFYNIPSLSGYGYYDCVVIDQVEVRSTAVPAVELSTPLRVEHLDNNLFMAHLKEGDTTGITFTWHSTMADDSLASFAFNDTILHISYAAEGIDTLTVVATNRHGSDTATAIVSVYNCPALGIPHFFYFENSIDLNCWSGFTANGNNNARESYGTPWFRAGDSSNHYMSSSTDRGWLVTPAIDLPADTTDLDLHWYQNNSTLNVYISTDSNHYFEPTDFQITAQYLDNTAGHHSYSLAAFAGQRIHIGFLSVYSSPVMRLDSICIAPNRVPPMATLLAPTNAYVRNRITVIASLETTRLGLTHSWHSSLASSGLAYITPNDTLLTVYYLEGGLDTITYIVSNQYGADTQQVIITVDACNNYTVPYTQDFDSMTGAAMWTGGPLPECWSYLWNGNTQYVPHVLLTSSAINIVPHTSQVLFMMAGCSLGFDSVACVALPRFAADLRNFSVALSHVHENANYGTLSVGYITDTFFVPIADLPAVAGSSCRDTVSFDSLPDNATHIALRWSNNTRAWYSVAVDDIVVFIPEELGTPPAVTMIVPDIVRTYDTAFITAHLMEGDTARLTYYWHSMMAEMGQATIMGDDSLCTVVYSSSGTDTITLVAVNAFGSDTLVAQVHVESYHTLSVLSADSTMGIVSGGGLYREGDTVVFMAAAFEGYHFTQWSDGDTLSMRQVVVVRDTEFVAYFEADTQDVGIHNPQNPTYDGQLTIYPNPLKGFVNVDLHSTLMPATFMLFDMEGRQVMSRILSTRHSRLDVSHLPAGAYVVRLDTEKGVVLKRLVVLDDK